jgi:hypothetical protein
MAVMEGRITIVQESRFQLTDDHGVAHLFTLGPKAAAEPEQLPGLAARQAKVRVRFRDADNVIGYLAESIRVQDQGEDGR